MKTNTYISPILVASAENQKAMIFFFFLKSKYRNSVFYDYSPERLSDLTGLSINTVRKYVGWLVKNRYATHRNSNLWLKSTYKIFDNEKLIKVNSKAWTTWEQFKDRVLSQVIKYHIKQQAFHITMKGLSSGHNKEVKSYVRARKYLRTYSKGTKETDSRQPFVSVRLVARLFNRSTGWAHDTLKRLERNRYISRKFHVELLTYGFLPPEYYQGGGHIYYSKRRNAMILHKGSLITVNY